MLFIMISKIKNIEHTARLLDNNDYHNILYDMHNIFFQMSLNLKMDNIRLH